MSFIWSWAVKKTVGTIQIGGDSQEADDPFHETIPHEELSWYQREGAKRSKPLPSGLSHKDQQCLKSVRRYAYQLDLAFSSCCGWKVGWAGIIGLIPWIGDVIALYFGYCLIAKAQEIDDGLPKYIEAQMFANLSFDFGIGLIPIVGDLINIAYKSNTRNCLILESYLRKKGEKQMKKQGIVSNETKTMNKPTGNKKVTAAAAAAASNGGSSSKVKPRDIQPPPPPPPPPSSNAKTSSK
ncbi:hypothetical protein WICPIJ_003566 [Wickerhamomyces pijperi]|uniref:Uncharacterized protein n=1 Tax=Wickerhamomyces pijperi TaxID=599730 RepID=A0A9P8Q7L9_WICPI|nr:hypothetical protein WICPIJ_003566 [Wickerhamomyces pijperi]